MLTPEQKIIALQHEIRQAQAEAERARRVELVEKLKATRAELKQAYADYRRLARQIKDEDAARDAHTRMIVAFENAISEHLREKPLVADILEDDEDVIVWRKRFIELTDARNRQMAHRAAVPMTPRQSAIEFEGDFGKIALLQRAEVNLVNAISGTIGNRFVGGINSVTL